MIRPKTDLEGKKNCFHQMKNAMAHVHNEHHAKKRPFWVEEPGHSENIQMKSDTYLSRSTRPSITNTSHSTTTLYLPTSFADLLVVLHHSPMILFVGSTFLFYQLVMDHEHISSSCGRLRYKEADLYPSMSLEHLLHGTSVLQKVEHVGDLFRYHFPLKGNARARLHCHSRTAIRSPMGTLRRQRFAHSIMR